MQLRLDRRDYEQCPTAAPRKSPLPKCAKWGYAACSSIAPTTAAATASPSLPISGPMTFACPTLRIVSPAQLVASAAPTCGRISIGPATNSNLKLKSARRIEHEKTYHN